MTCLYCDRRIPMEDHQQHRFEKHFDLQFKCSLCIEMLSTLHQGHFTSLDQVKKHLGEVHGETAVDNEEKLQELIRNGKIILPNDLRSLNCRFCEGRKILLAQDRMAMSVHIRHRHDMKIPRHVFKYQCRMCFNDFKSSEDFLSEGHQCQQLLLEFQQSAFAMEREDEIAGPSMAADSTNSTNVESCHYCPTRYPVENKASHRGKHSDLDFMCVKCTRSFPFLEDIKLHLSKDHELAVEANDGVDGKDLADKGWLLMPKDLRIIQCPETECLQPFLAQDRQTVLSHLKKTHGKLIEGGAKLLLNYGCRSCEKGDFSNSAEVFNHGCLPNSKYDRNGDKLALGSSEELLPLTDLVWNTDDIKVPGDLRRMACRLCGFQVNGQRFFKMVHHLEKEHDKFQQCKAYKLDFFVKFGCGHCPQFVSESVHTWDKHFQGDFFTKCVCMSCVAGNSDQTSSNIAGANSEVNSAAMENTKILANDIRLLICKICSATYPKRGFEDIQAHLKSEHTQEIVDSPMLADFVDFGCIKCPQFSPRSLAEWKGHFFLSNTTCNESHSAMVANANLSGTLTCCRRLACKMCTFVACDYYVFCKHMEEQHGVDTKPSNFNHKKEVFEFKCYKCPNFKPEDKHRWDRHFSSDNPLCQGSGKVEVMVGGKSRVLYWCDTCQETRENIHAHFTGSSHQAAVEVLLSKNANVQMIRCDTCAVTFTSQGNFDLHLQGDSHWEKQLTNNTTSVM